MIRLTDEEIKGAVGDFILTQGYSNLLKHLQDSNQAQLRKVVEYLESRFFEEALADRLVILKKDWQALLEEVR